ncbi:Phage tail fiber protein |nr:Phage tail fiber protein \
MPEGATIADLVQQSDIDKRMLLTTRVVISKGLHHTVVPVDQWHRVRPREGSHVLIGPTIHGPIAGAILTAIIPSAASYVASAAFSAGLISGVGTFAYTAVTAAVTIVGSLLVNALIPPPSQPGGIQQDDPNYSITGSSNAEVKYGVYPTVLGRHKMFPPKTASGHSEGQGKEIYYRGRYTLGYGPVALESLKIGTTPITEFDGVTLEFLNVDQALTLQNIPELANLNIEGWRTGSEVMTLYPDDIAEDAYSDRLNQGDAITRNTRARTTAAEVDVLYQGLTWFDKKNRKQELSRQTGFRFRKVGDTEFTDAGSEEHRGATTANLRFTKLIEFPEPGEYEIEVTRLSEDSSDLTVQDDSYLSGIRSIRTGNLPSHSDIAEIAVRIRASEQLSGQLDELSGIVQQLAPVWDGTSWSAPQPVRHPAWIYARALMGPMLEHPIADSRLQLQDILDWVEQEPHWTCDAVIDQSATVAEVLDMICATGRARRTLRDLKYSIIRDGGAGPVVQQFSPRNSYDFHGSISFPKEIHAFRVRCLSEKLDWQQDEITVYADGYDASTATEFETLDLRAVVLTESDATGGNAWRLGRYHLAQAVLRYEQFSWKSDLDHLRVNMGDKVRFIHDVPMIGVGAGRVKSFTTDLDNLLSFTLDNLLTPEAGDYRVNWRTDLGDEVTFRASPPTSQDGIWTVQEDVSAAGLKMGDLLSIELMAQESVELLITSILHEGGDLQATLTGVPAAPAVLQADSGTIPPYVPTITNVKPNTSLKPGSPRIISAVARNIVSEDQSGGRSVTVVAELEWLPGAALSAERFIVYRIAPDGTRDQVDQTEGTSGTYTLPAPGRYRFEVFGVNSHGRSEPGVEYVDRSVGNETPGPVTGFVSRVAGDQMFLSWKLGEAIVSHYHLRYLALGASGGWRQASLVDDEVSGNQIAIPAVNGRYLIKAVSLFGRESEAATEVIVEGAGLSALNVVELVQEHPAFSGAKTAGLSVQSGSLMLLATTPISDWASLAGVSSMGGFGGVTPSGVYDFADITDLGEVYTSRLSADVRGFGFRLDDVIGSWGKLSDVEDLTGTTTDAWAIDLQMSSTSDDPMAGGAEWSDWETLRMGDHRARAYRFRLLIESESSMVAVRVDQVSVTIDMPDRIEGGADVPCPAGGLYVDFDPPFRVRPAIAADGQGLPTGAISLRSNVTREGFHQKFVDATGADIACTFDWVAKGYGRVL